MRWRFLAQGEQYLLILLFKPLSNGGSVMIFFNYYVIYLSPLVCDVEIVTSIGLDFTAKATSFAFMLLWGTFFSILQ